MMTNKTTDRLTAVNKLLNREDSFAPKANATKSRKFKLIFQYYLNR